MAKNRGKEFEDNFKKTVEESQKNGFQVDIQRLYDVIGKKTIEQPADFTCYYKPNEIYVECKSTNDSSFSYYTQPQYERLIKKSLIDGVKAGMLVWFVKYKRVFWVDIDWMQGFYNSRGIKSFTVGRLEECVKNNIQGVFEVDQTTKRINPEMRIESMFEFIRGEN